MADTAVRTAELLSWASDTAQRGAAALPEHVLRTAVTIVCDDLAAMLTAHAEAEVGAISEQAVAAPGAESTVVGRPGGRAERRRAAFANAIAANWTELDGGYRPATCHGSLYTLPSALAEVEAEGGTFGDLLVALVTGYEVVTRVARAYRPPLPLVRHPHATLSPIGAAAALAAARRLPAERFARTVLGAASMSPSGPFSHAVDGATVRNAWAGAGAQLGFAAADSAAAGLTAAPEVLREVFADAGGATAAESQLTDGLGERYGVEDGYQKPYACCQYLHSTVEAAGELVSRLPADASAIAAIEVRTHPLAAALRNAEPATTLAGRFSLPHAVATVLSTRDTGVAVFGAPSLREPGTARLRRLVRVEEWTDVPAAPHDRPSTVRVVLADGTAHEQTVLSAAGGPDRPFSREDLLTKFGTLTADLRPGFAAGARALTDPGRTLELDAPLGDVLATLLGEGA
ncbi:MmgE/PrpD family protein [Prauserella cavernicola]|uniref:MmgE/PrpD family protein n=1 Tax=Prauserella cavernicola TaxID=2800127 RepID=A0A934V416_9PSEU|nr:MmgE/PrpD family protein [Prauserella cavernicola]MBK1783640.1 MmgE/PrpD family protein [Prauserella cavernicola]